MANRPLTLRLRRVGGQRLLRRRAEMHALTRPHGVHAAFGATAAAANGAIAAPVPPAVVVGGKVPQPGAVVSAPLGSAAMAAAAAAAPPPPPPPLPSTPLPSPAPPVRMLRRQDSFPLGDARRNAGVGNSGAGNGDGSCGGDGEPLGGVDATATATAVAGAGAGVGVGAAVTEESRGEEGVADVTAAASPVCAVKAPSGTDAVGEDNAREAETVAATTAAAAAAAGAASAAAAAAAAAAADYAGNWEAVEWAESCLVSVSFSRTVGPFPRALARALVLHLHMCRDSWTLGGGVGATPSARGPACVAVANVVARLVSARMLSYFRNLLAVCSGSYVLN